MRNGDLFRKIVLLAVTLALFLTSCGGQAGETTVGDGDAVVDAPVEVIATGNETDEDENLAEELSSAAEEPVGLGGPIVIDTYHLSPFDVDEARFGECLAAEINATMGPLGKARLDQIAQPVRDNVVEAMTLDSEISDIDALDMFAEQIVGCFSKEELTIRLGELRTAGPSGSEDCVIDALDGDVEATRWVAHAQGKQFSPIGDVQSRRGLADANWDAVFESETSMEEMVASCLPSGDLGTALAAAYDPPFDSCLTNELSAVFTPDELNQVGHGDRGVFPGSPDLVWNSEDSTVLPRFTHAMANCFTDEQLF